MLTEDMLKVSCFDGDGGSFISKIRELENETNVDIQCIHVNTSSIADETMTREKILIKTCDRRSTEVRKKCEIENREEKMQVKGNMQLIINEFKEEKSVAEVIKLADSRKYCEKYLDHKFKNKWVHADAEARNAFKCCSPSMLK